jgi:cytochrome d ubiquinol oxidase subunit II
MANVDLARWQFAFVTINHFFFVPITIGLAFLTAFELLAAIAAIWLVHSRSDGFAFAATTVTMAACVVSIFTGLYPNVMVSSTNPAYNLTVHNTASGAYSLKVMTVVVVIFLPFVLAYQTWTYYVFRRRISKQEFRPSPTSAGGPPAGPGN